MTQINICYVVGALFISTYLVQAQNPESIAEKDTNNLGYQLRKGGKFYVQARTYFSTTINDGRLTDYYALGIGAGIGYETPRVFRYFQARVSGYSMFNVASSNLQKTDPRTNQLNRYEIGLFDIENPDNHKDLNHLEELYIKAFVSTKSKIIVGRQIPQTPFINPQDGRMRPTFVESAVVDLNEWKNLKIYGAYIWQMSPRSTIRWFNIGESIGLYPVGVGVTGESSKYKNNTSSSGIGIAGISYQNKRWNIQLWNNYVDNINNTGMLKVEWKSKPNAGKNWLFGGQFIHQNTLGDGGNEDPAKAYAQKGNGANIISGRLGQQSNKFTWFLNATRITDKGRYLMPREWGRDPFYTFIPREKNEGFGDLTAVTVNTFCTIQNHIRLELSAGYFQLPDVKNFTLNKYGMPSYAQVNLGLTYQFENYLKGLNLLLLIARKDQIGETYQKDRFVLNKVNMTHLNLILNYQY
ncbi:OprD family outer membrane porin [Emticicia sp. BO119]|uniref:OprD family outer membrane porin n=1 Tax=Emticicia sp. BO119 TaxID=2757768 RepID=UPI0015F119F3|nr:OprD family outer membrane porin [Emticicia sp. BO119]MBA4850969.1 outer membrane porin, OprD family [Emticicia sp. BO119]